MLFKKKWPAERLTSAASIFPRNNLSAGKIEAAERLFLGKIEAAEGNTN
jgi:hypothetical protein